MLYFDCMTKETKVFLGIIAGFIILITGLFVVNAKTPGKYDEFATCIADSGATFYGTFWCPFCNKQKQSFGKSAKNLPYVECSNPDQTQTEICIEKEITGYPTWEFADGTRLSGLQDFATLAEKTSCPLPENTPIANQIGETSEAITTEAPNITITPDVITE